MPTQTYNNVTTISSHKDHVKQSHQSHTHHLHNQQHQQHQQQQHDLESMSPFYDKNNQKLLQKNELFHQFTLEPSLCKRDSLPHISQQSRLLQDLLPALFFYLEDKSVQTTHEGLFNLCYSFLVSVLQQQELSPSASIANSTKNVATSKDISSPSSSSSSFPS